MLDEVEQKEVEQRMTAIAAIEERMYEIELKKGWVEQDKEVVEDIVENLMDAEAGMSEEQSKQLEEEDTLCDYYKTIYAKSSYSGLENYLDLWSRRLTGTDRHKDINHLRMFKDYKAKGSSIFIEILKPNKSSDFEIENYWNSCFTHGLKKGNYKLVFFTPKDYGDVQLYFVKGICQGYSGSISEIEPLKLNIPKMENPVSGNCHNGDVFFEKVFIPTFEFKIQVLDESGQALDNHDLTVDELEAQNIYDYDFDDPNEKYTVKVLGKEDKVLAELEDIDKVMTVCINSYQYDSADYIDEDYEKLIELNEVEFPTVRATLYKTDTNDVIFVDSDVEMKLVGDYYESNLLVNNKNHNPHSEFHWVIEGPNGEKLESESALITGKGYYPRLKVRTKRIESTETVKVKIDFKPEVIGLEQSQESLPNNFLDQNIYAARWELTGMEKFRYCIPRTSEKLILKGLKNLTSTGDENVKEVFDLPERTHYFQFYTLIISSSDSNFEDGGQIDRGRVFDAASNAIGDWASLEAIIGVQTGIENVCAKIKKEQELIEWRATLAKDLTTLIADIIDQRMGGVGIAPVLGDLIVTYINLNKDAYKPKDADRAALLNAGADFIKGIAESLRTELNTYNSPLYSIINSYILNAGQKQEADLINTIQDEIGDFLPKKDVFMKEIEKLHNERD